MKLIVHISAILVCLFGTATLGSAAAGTKPPKVIVAPGTVQRDHFLFLSGANFASTSTLGARISCPNGLPGHVRIVDMARGIRTDRHGQFAGFAVGASPVHGTRPVRCQVDVGVQAGTPFSLHSQATAGFTLVPRQHALPRCAARMCLHVRAFLVRLRNYAQGNVTIAGWPGATAGITVIGPATTTMHRTTRLDWRGTALVRMHVAPGLLKGVRARVEVRADLGMYQGTGTAAFAVLPGIR